MKKVWYRKPLSIMLAAGMTISLAACGSGGGDTEAGTSGTTDSATRYFRADYLDNLPDGLTNTGTTRFNGDKLYYSAYSDDYSTQTVSSFDVVTNETIEYCSYGSSNGDDVFAETVSLSQFAPSADGGVLLVISTSQIDESTIDKEKYENATREDVINYIYSNWGFDSYEAAEEYFNSYESDLVSEGTSYGDVLLSYEASTDNYIRHTYLAKVDESGTEVFRTEIATDSSNSYCNAVGADGDGNMYVAMEEWTDESDSTYVLVYDKDGANLGTIDLNGSYIYRLVNTADNQCAYLTWSTTGENYSLTVLDASTLATGEEIPIGSGYVSDCVAIDDHTYLYSGDRGLKQYDTTTQEAAVLVNWMDCNISSSSVSSFGVLSDGRIAVYMQSWGTSGYDVDIAILDEMSEEEAASVTQINLACFYMDSNTESAVIEFNKKNTDYHISVTEYYDYSSDVDYQDALDSFVTAISSDSSIDIVNFYDYSQMLDFAAKGLLIDLNDVLSDDEDLGGGKILPNIINACTFDDKLVALPNQFSVTTLVGKVSDVGTTPGWTVADLKALYDTKDPDTQVLTWTTKETAFNMCISLGYSQFIDLENKTCNFNTQEFVDVLEFVSLFPDEYSYDEEMDQTELMNQGKILLYETGIPDFAQMQMLSTIFADDLTYIGYPTSSGNGSMMEFTGLAGITTYCKNPEVAWQFLRQTYLTSGASEYYGVSYFSGSILQADFDEYFANATNPDDYSGTWGWGNYETEIHAPTQDEVDQVKEIILESTAVSGAVSTGILNIIKEEASAYFSGQKTAEEVAATIQSRLEIYLSETM